MNTLSYKTISANASTVNKEWILLDVNNLPLGRVSTAIANFLRGKHKTNYTPHVDCGDNVIVINASTVTLSGNKCTRVLAGQEQTRPAILRGPVDVRASIQNEFDDFQMAVLTRQE